MAIQYKVAMREHARGKGYDVGAADTWLAVFAAEGWELLSVNVVPAIMTHRIVELFYFIKRGAAIATELPEMPPGERE